MNNRIVIFRLPFRGPTDEFLPLRGNPAYEVEWVRPQDYDGKARVIILPGSGRTIDDLAALRESGGAEAIRRHLAEGGIVVGVCGGYQILGQWLYDPRLSQGSEKLVRGLGYLPHSTMFGPSSLAEPTAPAPWLSSKTSGLLLVGKGAGGTVTGEERRSGFSYTNEADASYLPLIAVLNRELHESLPEEETIGDILWQPGRELVDGLVSSDRQVWGSYLHLIFHNDAFLRSFFEVV